MKDNLIVSLPLTKACEKIGIKITRCVTFANKVMFQLEAPGQGQKLIDLIKQTGVYKNIKLYDATEVHAEAVMY
jgi:pentose-5-phosphate-3-epimerase